MESSPTQRSGVLGTTALARLAIPTVIARRVTKDVYQLVREETVFALALRLTNDRWIHADLDGRRVGHQSYGTAKAVAVALSKQASAGNE